MAYEKLFTPLEICGQKIKNRYATAPVNFLNSGFAAYDGYINEQDIAYNVARAMGGAGLIIWGAVCPTTLGTKVVPHPFAYLNDRRQVPALYQFTESVHLAGAKIIVQVLPAAGSRATPLDGVQPIGPTGGLSYEVSLVTGVPIGKILNERLGPVLSKEALTVPIPREITYDEIQTLIAETAKNSVLAVWAGFDGIEVHTCHHYLVDEFRDPTRNKRTDKYGGSEENRNRLIVELVDRVVRSVKSERTDFMVGVRIGSEQAKEINGVEYGGYAIEETMRLAKQLEGLGIDYVHMTIGVPPTVPAFWPEEPDGHLLESAKKVKSVVNIPVITPSVWNPELAEKAITEGMTDMVSLGRPAMADPDIVNKIKEGKVGDITWCKREGFCWINFGLCLPGRCQVNPELGREKYNPKYQIRRGFKGTDMFPPVVAKKKRNK